MSLNLIKLTNLSRRLGARLLPALAGPGSCALCALPTAGSMCSNCGEGFLGQYPRRCRSCALPLPHDPSSADRCGRCLRHPPAFDATVVAADYVAPVDQLVLGLKFGHNLALASLFAQLLIKSLLREQAPLPTLLVAVPLGSQRLQERGFNQALEIARPLASALAIPVAARLLVRIRETKAQALLHPDERHKNIRGAFSLNPNLAQQVHGRHVGVVDDVMTTGETLNEIARTLKRFGAKRVTNLVFARTDLD